MEQKTAIFILWIAPRRSLTSTRLTVPARFSLLENSAIFVDRSSSLGRKQSFNMSTPYGAYYPPPAGVQPFPQPAPVAGGAAPPPPPYYPPQTAATASVQPAPYPAGFAQSSQPAVMQPSYNPAYVTAPPSAPPVTVIVQQQPGAQTAQPTQVVRPPPQQHQSGSSGMGMAGAAAVGMMAGAAVAGVAAAAHSRESHHHHQPPHVAHRPGLLSRGHHGPVNVHIHPQPTHWAARLAMRAKERRHH